MQSNPILYNAYGILGLAPNATRKDIEKQTKEIEKLLKIDEVPQYALDFAHFDSLRNEKNIREAKQNLLNAESKILHYFFSFYILSENERKIFANKVRGFNTNTFIDKKNVAILMYIYMIQNGVSANIERYLNLWGEVISDENLSKFKKMYLHDDDIGINENVLNNADSAIKDALILSHTNFAESIKDELIKINFIANIIEIFAPSDEVINHIKFIADIYKKINGQISSIENANEISTLKSHIFKLNTQFNGLRKLNLGTHSQTTLLKDRVSNILRNKSIYFHNEKNDAESAMLLIDEASKICGSDFERNKLKKAKEQLQDSLKHKEIAKLLDKVKSKVNAGDFYEFDEIESEIRAIAPNDCDDFIDQIAIIIGNKAIENANNALSGIQYISDRNTAIVRINNANNELETKLNIAKRYAKKQSTKTWLNNQMPKGAEIEKIREMANRINGGSGGKWWYGIGGLFLIYGVIFVIALIAEYPQLLLVIGGIIAWWYFNKK